MITSSDSPPLPTRPGWRMALGISLVTLALTLAARCLSPLPFEPSTMMWPVSGLALAVAIRFGWCGVTAVVGGAAIAALAILPTRPLVWVTTLIIAAVASMVGSMVMRRMAKSLLAYKRSSHLTRLEWLYCVYVAGGLVAPLLAGVAIASVRTVLHVHAQYLWYEVAAAYSLMYAFGCVVFTPLAVAAFSSLGYGHPCLPYSNEPFSLRKSVNWGAVSIAVGFTALVATLTFTGFTGVAYVLQLWCVILMAWCALRTRALSAYLTLAIIAITLIPLRAIVAVRLHSNMAPDAVFHEIFEGILIIGVGVIVTQIMQAGIQQVTSQQRMMEKQLRTDPQSGLLNEAGLRDVLVRHPLDQHSSIAVFHFPALPQLVAGFGFERAARVQATLAERISLFGEHATRLDPTTYCCVWNMQGEVELEQAIARTEEQLAGLRIRAGDGTLRLQCLMGVLRVDAKPDLSDISLPDAVTAAIWQLEGSLQAGGSTTSVIRMSDQLNLAARARGERAMMIRQALEQGQMELFVQPIESNLAPQLPETPIICEVLARLRLDDGTILPPGAFISICEQHGLIRQLDRTMVQKTFSWFAARPDALQRLGKCSINLSGQSISVAGVAAEIRALATSLNLPVGKFSFEITESEAIQDASAAVRTVAELRAAGFGTAIDDFGTGLATFAYLKRFEVDLIKIDGAFIRLLDDGMRRSEVDREIVRSIVRVAQTLGVKTAAEFVETAAIREHVTALGVHYSQGYAIAKPMPIAELFT